MSVLRSRRATLMLVMIVLLLAGMLLRPSGYLQPVENTIFTVLAPLQYGLHWLGRQVSDRVRVVRELGSLEAHNQELETTVDSLMIENVRLREAEIENANLREQLYFKLANPTYEMLAAEVIGYDPSNLLHYIVIDRGSQDGIVSGMPVVTARGLVGKVSATYPRSARVMLLTDPASSVSALIQSSRATGIIQGQGRAGLIMRYVEQNEQVEVGDIVLSSGLGGNLPKRLVIGTVTSVTRAQVEMFQEVQVQSAVQFDRLEMVLVIQGFELTE
jgi:rod shape-determining protein MreC